MKEFNKYEKRGAYHWSWHKNNNFNYRDRVNLILKYFPNKGSLLDVGCGDGQISWLSFIQGLTVTGIDTNNFALKLARKTTSRLPIEIHHNNVISFENKSIYSITTQNTYDYIICNEVIEHLENVDTAIKNMHNAAKKFCIITTPDAATNKVSEYDFQLFDRNGIDKLFKDYHIECVQHYGSFWIKLYK